MGFFSEPTQSMATSHPRPISLPLALPPLAPKGTCTSAPALRQLGQSTERRRVPRPRFRLANQKPSKTRRSLLADLNAVEDVPDDGDSNCCVDYSFRASSLIKAHVQPQQEPDYEQWYVRKRDILLGYQVLSVH